jgi:hypothetical protein
MEAVSFGQGLKRLRRKKKRTQKNGAVLWKSFFSAAGVLLLHEVQNFRF